MTSCHWLTHKDTNQRFRRCCVRTDWKDSTWLLRLHTREEWIPQYDYSSQSHMLSGRDHLYRIKSDPPRPQGPSGSNSENCWFLLQHLFWESSPQAHSPAMWTNTRELEDMISMFKKYKRGNFGCCAGSCSCTSARNQLCCSKLLT